MRMIERSTAFKRDYKKVKTMPKHHKDVDNLLMTIITALASDHILPKSNRDHALNGNFFGFRECHLKPDLLLIYQKLNMDILKLARLGSHSELFK